MGFNYVRSLIDDACLGRGQIRLRFDKNGLRGDDGRVGGIQRCGGLFNRRLEGSRSDLGDQLPLFDFGIEIRVEGDDIARRPGCPPEP